MVRHHGDVCLEASRVSLTLHQPQVLHLAILLGVVSHVGENQLCRGSHLSFFSPIILLDSKWDLLCPRGIASCYV